MGTETEFADLDRKLREAVDILTEAQGIIRDLDFSPREQIRRIGHAKVWVFEIQHAIYDLYPSLEPEALKEARRLRGINPERGLDVQP